MKKISLAMCVAAVSTAMVACAAPAAQPAAAQPAAAQPVATMQVFTTPDGMRKVVTQGGRTRIVCSADGEVSTVIQQTQLPTAIVNHDAAATFAAAQKLQKIEMKRKAIDDIFNSGNAYKLAATFAAGQGNTVLAQQIVTAAPATQPIVQQMVITRSAKKNAKAAIPQMVEVKFGGWDKLTPAQAPIWGDYIMAFYPTLNRATAAAIATKVNNGRHFMPVLLAQTAVELGKLTGKGVPAAFQAKNVFANAVDMAIFLGDKAAMKKIVALYDTASFKDAKTAKNLAAELRSMGKTRSVIYRNIRGRSRIMMDAHGNSSYEGDEVEEQIFSGKSEKAWWMMKAMQ